jgi:hypothetical protein
MTADPETPHGELGMPGRHPTRCGGGPARPAQRKDSTKMETQGWNPEDVAARYGEHVTNVPHLRPRLSLRVGLVRIAIGGAVFTVYMIVTEILKAL